MFYNKREKLVSSGFRSDWERLWEKHTRQGFLSEACVRQLPKVSFSE